MHICAAAPPEDLFFPDALQAQPQDNDQILAEALSETLHAPTRPNVSVYNYSPAQTVTTPARQESGDASRGKVGAFSVLSIFTGEDERFAYVRLHSRI